MAFPSLGQRISLDWYSLLPKLGPTELRLILIIVNTLFIFIRPLREFSQDIVVCGQPFTIGIFDYVGAVIVVMLMLVYVVTLLKDLDEYARMDPPKPWNG